MLLPARSPPLIPIECIWVWKDKELVKILHQFNKIISAIILLNKKQKKFQENYFFFLTINV